MGGLWSLIAQIEMYGALSGIRVCKGAPNIHHLLLANDSFLFGKANIDEYATIQEILDVYSQASGKVVNFSKSSVAFSINVGQREQSMLAFFWEFNWWRGMTDT